MGPCLRSNGPCSPDSVDNKLKDENKEDSVCNILCAHGFNSGIGMGTQVCACAKMYKGIVFSLL